MSQFYQVDSAKVSLREYWWGTRSPLVVIGWLLKLLRIRIPGSTDDPNTESTLPFVAPNLPPQIDSLFAPLTHQLTQLGFVDPVFHTIYDAGCSTTWYWATFRHSSGNVLARIHHRVWGRSTRPKPVLFPMFITPFTDGTFLVSSAGKPDLATPETVELIRKPNTRLEPLWLAHEQRAQQLTERKNIKSVTTPDEIITACESLHVLLRDFHLARGVFRPRTEAENLKAQETAARVEQARAYGYENAEVLVELEKLQDKKTSKQTIIWILVLSLVGFYAMGAAYWNSKVTLWLIPILFFHEAGHWVTMRIFKYRNLRMFFIPLFGAAVMGRHWNVPGWKKALVSLAGPIPGIIVGLGFGIASIALHSPWMNKVALLLLLLNGLNLLPIFPMDGGHVLQDTIFCRNRWLEVVFRSLAIGGLLLFGVGSRAFLTLGIALAVSLPFTFKLAKVKEDLSKLNLPQPAPGEDHIPFPTANAVISAVRTAFGPRMRLSNKALAQHSLNVFESLNAKPPGVLATLGLLSIQGGGLFIAVVMGLILAFTGQVELRDFAKAAARQPLHSVTCSALRQWGTGPVRPGHLIVTTFGREQKAAAAFRELTNQVPEQGELILYGQSVLLAIPAGDDSEREKWFDTMQSHSTNLFVRVSNAPIALQLTFIAPTKTVASNLTQEVGSYLHAAGWMHLTAPWSPEAHDAKYPQYVKARAQWQKIGTDLSKVYSDTNYTAYGAKIRAAVKRGATSEVKKLGEEQSKKSKELRAEFLQNVAATSDPVGADFARIYARLDEISYTNRVARQKLYREAASKMGEVRYLNDKPDPKADAYSASSGTFSMHGLLCELRWASFGDPEGLVSLTKWLCSQGCVQLKYDLQAGWGAQDFEEDSEEQ